MTRPTTNPFNHAHTPDEPPRGAVLAWQRLGRHGLLLDYVSMRAGDGKWYTTGAFATQGVDWPALWGAINQAGAAKVMQATDWTLLARCRGQVNGTGPAEDTGVRFDSLSSAAEVRATLPPIDDVRAPGDAAGSPRELSGRNHWNDR